MVPDTCWVHEGGEQDKKAHIFMRFDQMTGPVLGGLADRANARTIPIPSQEEPYKELVVANAHVHIG